MAILACSLGAWRLRLELLIDVCLAAFYCEWSLFYSDLVDFLLFACWDVDRVTDFVDLFLETL